MSHKVNAVDEMTRRVLEIVYPEGIFPNDYPKAIGIVSMIALTADGLFTKATQSLSSPSSAGSRDRRRSEPDEGAAAEESGSRRAAWDRAVARSQIGQRRETQPGGPELSGADD